MPQSVVEHAVGRVYVAGKLRWEAILAGAALAFAVQFCLTLVGLDLAPSGIEAGGRPASAAPFDGIAVWWTMTFVLSLFAGGYAAGRLSGEIRRWAAVHGLLVWAVTLLLGVVLAGSRGGAVAGGVASLLGPAAGASAQELDWARVRGFLEARGVDVRELESRAVALPDRPPTPTGAAERAAQAGIWMFLAMVFGALAGTLGGAAGEPPERRRRGEESY